MNGSERAVEALTALGLTTYEARAFVALVALGGGTAREVADVSEIPRPQVYGAAEDLEARGLLSIRRSSPIEYRPVSLDEARARLRDRFERERDAAFGGLEAIESTAAGTEQSEDVWTIEGQEAAVERAAQLVEDADERVVYGAADLPETAAELVEAMENALDRGVEVAVVRAPDSPRPDDLAGVTDVTLDPELQRNDAVERLLVVDDDVVLLSVQSPAGEGGSAREVAMWSAHTTFATAFARLILGSLPVEPA